MEPVSFDNVEVALERDNAPCGNMEQLAEDVYGHADAKPKLE
jgi:hypothetical protein